MMRRVAIFIARGVVLSAVVAVMSSGRAAAQPEAIRALASARVVPGLEEPLVPTRATSGEEDRALDAALAAFRIAAIVAPTDAALHLAPLESFVASHPDSAWSPGVLVDLGFAYHRAGYFARALDAWQRAWNAGRTATDPRAVPLVDRAVAELGRMRARLGNAVGLDRLLREVGNRALSGPASETLSSAREDAWVMRDDPGSASRSGSTALADVLRARRAGSDALAFLDGQRAGRNGFSLAHLASLAERAGVRCRLIRRQPGQAVPVPSVAHWNVPHFAAIIGEREGGYLVQDPTLGAGTDELWVSRDAIDSETSGLFLVPADAPQDPGWRAATATEATQARGLGFTAIRQTGATTPDDLAICPRCLAANPPTAPIGDEAGQGIGSGVAVYNAHPRLASLNLQVTQSGYASLRGPPVYVRLVYNQRDAHQPATFGFFNVSSRWTLNVSSYVEDDPAIAGIGVVRHAPGGGSVSYASRGGSYSTTSGAFAPEPQTGATLVRIPATGPVTSYELRAPDGGKQVFALLDGATRAPRRVFLTQIVDPHGNVVALHYDDRLRLRLLRDAAGRTTRLAYEQRDSPLLVTRITDPFGRSSTITYLADGRLGWSTDASGMTSSFTYDDAGLVDSMTTPYGTTTFRHGRNAAVNSRYLEITDPMGFAERVESFHQIPGSGLYWDKHALMLARAIPTAAPDPDRARRTYWTAFPQRAPSAVANERTTPPYVPPVPLAATDADGRAIRYTYNAAGQVLSATDHQQRITSYVYDSLGSLSTVTDPDGTTVLRLTYDAFDRVATTADASGHVLRFAYDDLDRLIATTYPDDTVERYAYDRLDLVAITDRWGKVTSFAYDANRRRTASTDPSGRVTRFDYYRNGVLKTLTEPNGSATTWGVEMQSHPVRHDPIPSSATPVAGTMLTTTAPCSCAPARGGLFRGTLIAALLLTLLSSLGLIAIRRRRP